MSGPTLRATREDVEAFWEEHAAARVERGFPPYATAPNRNAAVKSRQHLTAYVSDGRWVAQCPGGPNGSCNGGIAAWPEHAYGCCLDCGTVYPIDFPAAHTIAEATEALLARPPENRHWRPDEETPEQLRHENIEHGYTPRAEPGDWKTELAEKNGISVELVDEILSGAKRRK